MQERGAARMACQGCGHTSPTRLCCPTCIEFGRTSFFCNQECFTKNWASHDQLHDILRKKALLEKEVDSGVSVAGENPSCTSQRSKPAEPTAPPTQAKDAPNGRGRSLSPLPGGTPLGDNLRAAHKRVFNIVVSKKNDDMPAGAGVLNTFMGLARAAFAEAGGIALGAKPRVADAGQTKSGGVKVRPQPLAAGQKVAPPAQSRTMKQFAAQWSLWGLVVVAIFVGGIFYRELHRGSNEQQPSRVGFLESDSMSQVPLTLPLGATAGTAVAQRGEAIGSLRTDVAALQEIVQRHDKMMRYIMDRYVEKGDLGGALDAPKAGQPLATHEASEVNFSAPEFVSRGYLETPAARLGDTARKRKGGGDVSASVGLGEPDSVPSVERRGPVNIGAVAPEKIGPREPEP